MAQKEDAAEGIAEFPVRGVEVRNRHLRIRSDFQERLREAKLDFQVRFRGLETDETTILNQFLEEQLEAWIAKKLAPEEPPPDSTTKRKRA
jgi:hypothetical protein